jgi:hypothetical protein
VRSRARRATARIARARQQVGLHLRLNNDGRDGGRAVPGGRSGPANDSLTVTQTDTAEDIVRGFLAAFGAFDREAAKTYVADDADLRGLIQPPAPADDNG